MHAWVYVQRTFMLKYSEVLSGKEYSRQTDDDNSMVFDNLTNGVEKKKAYIWSKIL